eukprot:PhF_6_TR31123/c1_g1_i2/m.45557
MDSILGPVDCPQFHDWDCQENDDLKSPKYFLRRQPPRSTASQAFPRRQQVIQKRPTLRVGPKQAAVVVGNNNSSSLKENHAPAVVTASSSSSSSFSCTTTTTNTSSAGVNRTRTVAPVFQYQSRCNNVSAASVLTPSTPTTQQQQQKPTFHTTNTNSGVAEVQQSHVTPPRATTKTTTTTVTDDSPSGGGGNGRNSAARVFVPVVQRLSSAFRCASPNLKATMQASKLVCKAVRSITPQVYFQSRAKGTT